jgi:hydroxymethylpyrimidine pyrophosphatase-like HAD family hydrolase
MLADFIQKMFDNSIKKEWYETYWAFDLHGTILLPNHKKNLIEMNYYPFALETLQLLTERPDIKMILWTSSFPKEIDQYVKNFKLDNIYFDAINENPNISSRNGNFGHYDKKFYFNVMFEDKAGFNPEIEWEQIYNLLKKYEEIGFLPNLAWTTKF